MTKSHGDYLEYQIDYDRDLGCFWVSGLTPEKYWIETEFIQVYDDPTEKVKAYADDLSKQGFYVDVMDITDEDDTFQGPEDDEYYEND